MPAAVAELYQSIINAEPPPLGAGTVAISLLPATVNVEPGGTFDLTIQVAAGAQELDGVEVHLNFDPTLLQIASATTAGSAFQITLQNTFDNINGFVDFTQGSLPLPGVTLPSGTFTLATVHFSAVALSPSTSVSFNTDLPRQTNATNGGNSFLGTLTGATVTIAGTTANNDTLTTNEDTAGTVNVVANDTDPQNDTLTVTAVTQGAHGSVVNNNNGTVTYTPNANYNGSDSFTYTISDGNGHTATGTVNVTVTPVNDAPDAVNDSATTNEDTATTINVLANDTDVENDTLTITGVTQGAHGSVTNNGTDVTYTPNANYNGSDSFTYTISDGNGGTDTATVNVTVTPVNDAPDAVDDNATTNEDTPVTVNVLANDTDPDGDTLTVWAISQGTNGTVTNNNDGTVTYTPNANFNGADSFTYSITDGHASNDTATVHITVTAINDAPDAVDDNYTVNEDSSSIFSVLVNDTDIENDALSIIAVSNPSHGTVDNNTTDLTYWPSPNYSGPDSFTYTISDGHGGTDTATVSITVTPVNDAPDAVNDTASTNVDHAININVLANDTDIDGDTLIITGVTQGTSGTVTNNTTDVTYTPNAGFQGADSFTYTISDGNGGTDTATVNINVVVNAPPVANTDTLTTAEDTSGMVNVLANDTDQENDTLTVTGVTQGANGSVVNNGDGTVTYTPNPNFHGSDSFTYTVSDGTSSNDGTVNVTVTSVNDVPDAVNDIASTNEDTAVNIPVLGNDTDADGDTLTITGVTQGANGSVTNNGTDVTYTPNANFHGSDSFTYTISDGNGGSDTATVNVTVNSVNDAPDAVDDVANTTEDTPVTISVLANDTDADGDTLTITGTSTPANGSLVTNGDGTITYTPNANFSGTDSFTYTIGDSNGGSDTATVTVNVGAVDDAPVANNDTAVTDEDTPVVVDVLANDTDTEGDTLSVSAVTNGANGSVTNNGTNVTYTPSANFNGTDSFTYTASDGNGGFDTATVTVTVNAVNDAPNAVDDGYSTPESTPLTVAAPGVLANDTDVDGDSLTAALDTNVSNGVLAFNPDGSFTYTPNTGFSGTDSFTYTVSDGNGGTDGATVSITIAENAAPVANDDTYSTLPNTTLDVAAPGVLGNDTDAENQSLTAVLVSTTTNGVLTFNPDGSFTYVPDAAFIGSDSFTYQANDGIPAGAAPGQPSIQPLDLSNVATVTINVGAVATAIPYWPSPTPLSPFSDYEYLDDVIRSSVPEPYRNTVFGRLIVRNGNLLPGLNYGYIGNAELVQMGILDAIDIYSTIGTKSFGVGIGICIKGQGRLFFLDANFTPRSPRELDWTYVNGYTCGTILAPGIVVLVPGDGSVAPAPVAAAASSQTCDVTMQATVHLRAAPTSDSASLTVVPVGTTLSTSSRSGDWYAVSYGGASGYVSARWAVPSSACGL